MKLLGIEFCIGSRPDFRLRLDHLYWDGDIYTLNLGWFWIAYSPNREL